MLAKDILDEAIRLISTDRRIDHGNPIDSFKLIAEYWSLYRGVTFTPEQVAMMMALLKISRSVTGKKKPDHYIDLAGYAGLAGELTQLNEVAPKTSETVSSEDYSWIKVDTHWVD